jgi:hypothetical protein
VDDFEMIRSFHRRNGPRSIPWRDRKDVLLEWGATFSEITNAVREANKAKHKRRRTVNSIGRYDRFEEVLETATQKLKQSFSLDNVYKKHLNGRNADYRHGKKISSDSSRGSSQSPNSSDSVTPSLSSRDDYLLVVKPELQLRKASDHPVKVSVLKTESDYSTVAITPSVSSRYERDPMGSTTDVEKLPLNRQDKPISKPIRSPSLSHSESSMSSTTEDFESSPVSVSEASCALFSSFSTFGTMEESTVHVASFSSSGKPAENDYGIVFSAPISQVDGIAVGLPATFAHNAECDCTPETYPLSQNTSEPDDDEASIPSQYLNLLDDGSITSAGESQAESILNEAYEEMEVVAQSEIVRVPIRCRIRKPVGLGEFSEC